MDHNATNALIDAVEAACHREIDTATAACEDATSTLVAAVSDAYNSGIPSHTVAAWLGCSRASYYRFLQDHHIVRGEIIH